MTSDSETIQLSCKDCKWYAHRFAPDGTPILYDKSTIGYCGRPMKTWWGGCRSRTDVMVDSLYWCEKFNSEEEP